MLDGRVESPCLTLVAAGLNSIGQFLCYVSVICIDSIGANMISFICGLSGEGDRDQVP